MEAIGDLLRGHLRISSVLLVYRDDVVSVSGTHQRHVDLVKVVDKSVVAIVVATSVNHTERSWNQHLLGKSLPLHAGHEEPIGKSL